MLCDCCCTGGAQHGSSPAAAVRQRPERRRPADADDDEGRWQSARAVRVAPRPSLPGARRQERPAARGTSASTKLSAAPASHKRKLCRVLHNNCVIVFRRKSQLCNIAAIPAQTHGNKNYAPCACVLCADVVDFADIHVAVTCLVDSRSTSHNTTGCASVCGALCRATRTVFITLWTVGRHQVCASSKGCFFKRICTESRTFWCM